MVGGGGAVMLIEKGAEFISGIGALSVTVTVKGKVPIRVGVPLSAPLVASVSPGGSAPPVTAQLSGRYPPVALNVKGLAPAG